MLTSTKFFKKFFHKKPPYLDQRERLIVFEPRCFRPTVRSLPSKICWFLYFIRQLGSEGYFCRSVQYDTYFLCRTGNSKTSPSAPFSDKQKIRNGVLPITLNTLLTLIKKPQEIFPPLDGVSRGENFRKKSPACRNKLSKAEDRIDFILDELCC